MGEEKRKYAEFSIDGQSRKRSTDSVWTIPNAICVFRIVGSAVLLSLGVLKFKFAFACLFAILSLSYWIDGKIARLFNQRSTVGPRLDTVADVSMYVALVLGAICLDWQIWLSQWPWIAAVLFSYACAISFAFAKFGGLPNYHTRLAKACWLFVGVAVFVALAGEIFWPARLAAAAVTLANLESLGITWVCHEMESDVTSLWHARRKCSEADSR